VQQALWSAAAARLRTTVRNTFRAPHSGLYYNGVDGAGQLDRRFTSFAQAFAVAYNVAQPDELDQLFAWLDDPSKRPQRWSLSQVVELTAYAKAGRTAAGLARLRALWQPMVERGYRRFFEDIRPAQSDTEQLAMYSRRYGNSLCHAWAGAAPVMLLSRGVLGVEPLTPGFALCQVTPAPSGIAAGYGTVPTPRGLIEVEWSKGKAEVVLPSDTSARLADGRVVAGKGRHTIPVAT
jgi:alpha-L-rhamnosidase